MTDDPSQSPEAEVHPLDALASEHDDPAIIPDEVRRLFDAGQARKARKLLLRLAAQESDEDRAARQHEVADHPRMWLDPVAKPPTMYTVNGIGTMLYGKARPADDGTYISTLWATFVFLPVFPLGSYLVAPAPGGGWYFLAKAPLSRLALGVRRFFLFAVLAIGLRVAWGTYWSSSHVPLVAYNGFDQAVVVSVAGDRAEIGPRQHVILGDVQLEPATIETRWEEEDAPFETVEYDFTGHADGDLIYNVANRAALRVDYVRYGEGEPDDGYWLDERINVVRPGIDHYFTDPPESIRLSDGASAQRSVLYDAGVEGTAVDAVAMLIQADRRDHALRVARGALLADPPDAVLALLAARELLADDPAAQKALFRELIDRSPGAVDLHRYYQEIWPAADQDEVRAEYEALLEAHPDDPMYHYLVGRLEEGDAGMGNPFYRDALALDPDYPPVHRALAFDAAQSGDWSAAFAHHERYAAVDAAGGADVAYEWARIGRRIGRPVDEVITILERAAPAGGNEFAFRRQVARTRVADDPAAVGAEADALAQLASRMTGQEISAPLAANLRADLAITAGSIDEGRAALAQLDPEERSAELALRLALSTGATGDDLQRLTEIPSWFYELGPANKLLALHLLPPLALEAALDGFDPALRAVADLLRTPDRLRDPAALVEATREIRTEYRVAAYAAAARALTSVPDGQRARRFYVDEAYAMALPGELPYRG